MTTGLLFGRPVRPGTALGMENQGCAAAQPHLFKLSRVGLLLRPILSQDQRSEVVASEGGSQNGVSSDLATVFGFGSPKAAKIADRTPIACMT